MMPTTYASLAVLTALAPLVAPQPQDDFALASFDVSGCELLWDGGLDEHYVGTPYTDYEFFSGVRAGAGASLKTLNASAVSDVLLNASGAFDGKKSSDFAVVSPPNSKQFFLRAPQGSLAAVERNLAAMQAATAPERALVIERWTAALDSPQLSGGLLDAQAWAALSAGGSLTPAGRWQSQLTPGATAFVDARSFEPMIVDYDVEIAHNSFAFDEITFSATHGARGFARYGGGLGGGWLRVSFEFNAPVGDLRRTDFGGGGMLSDKDSASERKLGLSVESRDVLTDGFQIAGFLPKGGAYLIGLGTAKGGTRAVWYSVRVAGEGVEGVHRLTSENGSKTTLLVESEGFSSSDFGHWGTEHFGFLDAEGLFTGSMLQGNADGLMSTLALARADARPVGPFLAIEVGERSDAALVEQLLAVNAARATSARGLSVGGAGRIELPLVAGASARAWSLLCQLNPAGFEVEVAQGSASVDPRIGFAVAGTVVAGRPAGEGWSVELNASGAVRDAEPKSAGGWGRPSLVQPSLARTHGVVQVDANGATTASLGGAQSPEVTLQVR